MRFFKRPPDFVIQREGGDVYMLRWWVIPRNRFFNIYLHKFLKSDDETLHDHPWASMSLLLSGCYWEHVPADPARWKAEGSRDTVKHLRRPFRPVLRGPDAIHRVELLKEGYFIITEKPVWTLFFTGPWRRAWGFWCPKGFKPWQKYVEARDGGNSVGEGCGS